MHQINMLYTLNLHVICQIYFSFNKEALNVIPSPRRLLSKGAQTSHCCPQAIILLVFLPQKPKYLERYWGHSACVKGFFCLCCHSSLWWGTNSFLREPPCRFPFSAHVPTGELTGVELAEIWVPGFFYPVWRGSVIAASSPNKSPPR